MLTQEQRIALNDVLQDYWHEMDANDIIDDVVQIADPIEAAKYLEKAAGTSEQLTSKETEPSVKEYYLTEAKKFRDVAKLLRRSS